jgi:2,3-bisphosphoglycerate-dependent phosphoglycerate mutase
MPPTRVYLLRHAESANPLVFHGAESDVELSARGYRQAQAVAQYFAPLAPDVVISSAMRRARDTAAPIAQLCKTPHLLEPQLHERRVGTLSGTPCHDKDGVWPETLNRWIQGDTQYAPPGAESFAAIRDRVLPVWQRLTEQHAGRSIVVVAHGIICRVLVLSLLPDYDVSCWQRIATPNVGIFELVQIGSHWRAESIAEVPPLVREV